MEPYLPLLAAPAIALLLCVVVAAGAPDGRAAPSGASMAFRLRMVTGAEAVALAAVLAAPDPSDAWVNCLLGWVLLALAWIDARHFRLPDHLTLPLLLLGLAAAWWLEPWMLADRAIGAIAGYLALRLVGWAYAAWRGHAGLGQGDAKLLSAGGAWLGWEALSWVVLLAALAGIAWAGLRAARGHAVTARSQLAFGPFLALAIWVVRLSQPWTQG